MDRKVILNGFLHEFQSVMNKVCIYICIYFKFKGTNLSQIHTFSTKIVIEARLIYN